MCSSPIEGVAFAANISMTSRFRIGFRKRGARDCGEDREGVEVHTREINHQCRHLMKGEGKQETIRKRRLKQSLRVR